MGVHESGDSSVEAIAALSYEETKSGCTTSQERESMPVQNGIGYGEHTLQKQQDFEAIVSFHIDLTRKVQENWRQRGWRSDHDTYWYFDINAGAGYDPHGVEGSPLVFLRQARRRSIQYRATLIEIKPENCESLSCHIGKDSGVEITQGDHMTALPRSYAYGPARFGMLYCDPTGIIPPFDLLASFSRQAIYRRLDILIYLHATNIKRIRRSPLTKEKRTLQDLLSSIDKKAWLIREPDGKEQYTFLLGANWPQFPEWKERRFHSWKSPKGREIFERITYTPEELVAVNGQLPLFS